MLGLLVLAPVGALSAARGFDGLYGQDAFAYFDYATGPLRAAMLRGRVASPPPFFWPPGYPALVSLASLVVGPSALAGQLVSLLMGACVPVATALLALELWPGAMRRALMAGGLVAVCGQLWQSATVVMSDTTGLALATLGLWAVVGYGRRGKPGWLVLAAGLLGWATIARWIYGLVALIGLVYALGALLRVRAGPRRPIVHGRPALLVAGRLLVHGGPALLIGGSVLAWVLVPALGASGGQAAPFLGTLETYGSETWSLGNVLQREFMTAGHGFVRYALPNGVYYAAAPLHPFMLTPLLGVLCLPGLVVLVRARATAALALLLGWAWAMYAFHAGSTWQNLRYALAYLPPLAIVAAVGADTLLARPGWMRRAVGVWLVGGAVWAIAGGFVLTNQFIERKAADLATVRWVESQTPANAQVLTFGPTLTFRHYGQRETLELFELSPAELPAALATGRPTYLLLDVANVEEQWAGRAPADDYHWLRDGPGLTPLGERQTLTLYRVGGT